MGRNTLLNWFGASLIGISALTGCKQNDKPKSYPVETTRQTDKSNILYDNAVVQTGAECSAACADYLKTFGNTHRPIHH